MSSSERKQSRDGTNFPSSRAFRIARSAVEAMDSGDRDSRQVQILHEVPNLIGNVLPESCLLDDVVPVVGDQADYIDVLSFVVCYLSNVREEVILLDVESAAAPSVDGTALLGLSHSWARAPFPRSNSLPLFIVTLRCRQHVCRDSDSLLRPVLWSILTLLPMGLTNHAMKLESHYVCEPELCSTAFELMIMTRAYLSSRRCTFHLTIFILPCSLQCRLVRTNLVSTSERRPSLPPMKSLTLSQGM